MLYNFEYMKLNSLFQDENICSTNIDTSHNLYFSLTPL